MKLPASNAFGSNNRPGTATPDEFDYIAFKRTPRRRAKSQFIISCISDSLIILLSLAKVIQDIDIESEDPSSPSAASDDAVQSPCESESRSTGTPSTTVKPMTTRQAVLASVVDSSHVSLSDFYLSLSYFHPLNSVLNNLYCVDEGSKSKKQPLNETELALRREEIARKRKNLSEKKLEDEKVFLHLVLFLSLASFRFK